MDKLTNLKKNKILLVGPLPPPIGGVSIHLKRLSFLLENEFEIDYIDESHRIKEKYFNVRSLRFFQYFKKIAWSDLIYIHSGGKILKFFHIVIGKIFFKKIIITIHSYPFTSTPGFKFLDKFFFNLSNLIIVVNQDILDQLELSSKKCIVQPAFIPPDMEEEISLPASVSDWIDERKDNGKSIICANAWQLKTFKDQDLYGLDMCIEVAEQIIGQGYKISFIFIVSSLEKYREKYLYYQSIIKKNNLSEDFLLLNQNLSFVKLIEKSDIVLRPTNTDGDALTVREALFLGKPVIASNIVSRPRGTILFKTRDVVDLKNKLIETINNQPNTNLNSEYQEFKEYQNFYSDMIFKTIFN